jgi:hypothetical protein
MPGVKEFLKARPSPLPTCIFMSWLFSSFPIVLFDCSCPWTRKSSPIIQLNFLANFAKLWPFTTKLHEWERQNISFSFLRWVDGFLSQKCLEYIATYEFESGKSYIDPKFFAELGKRDKSSLSLINYFPQSKETPDDQHNNTNETEMYSELDKSKDMVQPPFSPSSIFFVFI